MTRNTDDSNDQFPITRRDAMRATGISTGALVFGGTGLTAFTGSAAAATASMTVRSGTTSQVVGYRAGDDSGAFPTSEPNEAADLTWVHPSWNPDSSHDFDTETQWIWHCDETSSTGQTVGGSSTYYVKEPVAGDVVEFEEDFSIPGTPTSGTLYITADNGYEVWVNGTHVGSAQVFDSSTTDWEDSELGQTYVNASAGSWTSVESYDVSSNLTAGANTLTVLGANEQQSTADGESDGTVTSNPGGAVYELDIEYETCTECTGDLLAKYEFECVETVDDECVAWDFTLEGSGDPDITYTPGNFTNKGDESSEPMSVTFGTDYCDLYVLVKSGQELEVKSFEDIDGSFTVETANDEKYAISFVAIYCDLEDAEAAYEEWESRDGNGGGKAETN